MADTTCQLSWMHLLLSEQHFPKERPTVTIRQPLILFADPVFHPRTKHIVIDFHFVLEWVHLKQIQPVNILSAHQLADVLTKGLNRHAH